MVAMIEYNCIGVNNKELFTAAMSSSNCHMHLVSARGSLSIYCPCQSYYHYDTVIKRINSIVQLFSC